MTDNAYYLAQLSISHARAPLDTPLMQGFVAQLKDINALAERSPGFVWRLQTSDGDATGIRGFDDPLMLLNMSLWESVDSLRRFVYQSGHGVPFRNAAEWFHRLDGPTTALWWVPKGYTPTLADGLARLRHIQRHGPTPVAFGFRDRFVPEILPLDADYDAAVPDQSSGAGHSPLVARCEGEVVGFHRDLERWLRGDVDDAAAAVARFRSSFAADSVLIAPSGRVETAASLSERLSRARGAFPDIRIWTDQFATVWQTEDVALVKYREWRSFLGETTGRMSSVLFRNEPAAPGGVTWDHMHETWLEGHGPSEQPIGPSRVTAELSRLQEKDLA
ncbi:DUF3291 domain-containing protein [Burkholderia sp. Bp9126]|nr:DUF3291 domain-containing protein [Burkholderia sp. Bp9126]